MNTILLLGMPGGAEWIIIGVILILLFGAKKIPQLMRGLGSGVKEFKEGIKEGEGAAKSDKEEKEKLN